MKAVNRTDDRDTGAPDLGDDTEAHVYRRARSAMAREARVQSSLAQTRQGTDDEGVDSLPLEPAGLRIGRFTLLGWLGAGGMGTVYSAYDEELDRKVAVKVLHAARRSNDEDRLRLWREAQAMARLSHPNVVTVHEVGESDGVMFVAMEFLRGQSFDAWLSTGPAWTEVLDAFLRAGRGLAAAHEAGLIHRDVKPANMMRTDDGVVKMLDFGLARSAKDTMTNPGSSGRAEEDSESFALATSLTVTGMVVGTPAYMAPEQHQGEPTDARGDQYGFCASVWEGLTGARPFSGDTVVELLLAKEGGPPSWPSPAPPVPRRIIEALRRGMSTSSDDRFPSMVALLEVLSSTPTNRRRAWPLALVGAGALGAAGVMMSASDQDRAQPCSGAEQHLEGIWDDERRAQVGAAILGVDRPYAEGVWERTGPALDAYADEWTTMHTEACEATVRGEQSPQLLDLRMTCLRRASVDLRSTVDTLVDADARTVHNAHGLLAGLPELIRCADAEALFAEVEPPRAEELDDVEEARVGISRVQTLLRAGRYDDAYQLIEEIKVALTGVEYGPVRSEVALVEGFAHEALARYDAAEVALEEAVRLSPQWGQLDVAAEAARTLMMVVGYRQLRMEEALGLWPFVEGLALGHPRAQASSRGDLATILNALGRSQDAEEEYRAALELWDQIDDPDPLDIARVRQNYAVVLVDQGKLDEAEAEFRTVLSLNLRILDPTHPGVAHARHNLGTILELQERLDEADAELRQAVSILEAAQGSDHPEVLRSRDSIASVLSRRGRHAEAEAEYRAISSLREQALGPEHPDVDRGRVFLAEAIGAQGRYPEAEAELRPVLGRLESVLGSEHPLVLGTRATVAGFMDAQGRHAEAESELREVLLVQLRVLHPNHSSIASSRTKLARALEAQGRYEDAESERRAALRLLEQGLISEHPDIARARAELAAVLLELDRVEEALPLAEAAVARFENHDGGPSHRARAAAVLARALWSTGASERERARRLAEEAVGLYRQSGSVYESDVEDLQRWLGDHSRP